jgi:hypothetical protein
MAHFSQRDLKGGGEEEGEERKRGSTRRRMGRIGRNERKHIQIFTFTFTFKMMSFSCRKSLVL